MVYRKPPEDDNPGYDSFLDVVCNLVGILVILIMVIGVRARNASEDARRQEHAEVERDPSAEVASAAPSIPADMPPPPQDAQPTVAEQRELIEEKQARLASAEQAFESLQRNTFELQAEMEQIAQVGYRKALQRDQLQLLVLAAEEELASRRERLSADQQQQLSVRQEVAEAERQLSKIEAQLIATHATVGPVQTLEHHPTPLAQTVFGHEEHFRLQEGRLCHVPINEIVEVLQSDAQNKVWKLKGAAEVTETIGPFEGFHVRYTLERKERQLPTPEGMIQQTVVSLKRFTLLPLQTDLGEPLAQALQPGSQLHQRMQQLDSRTTTITVWTYPDSFAAFRELKSHLLQYGFLAAARPLPAGFPIGGSPEGTRSVAE